MEVVERKVFRKIYLPKKAKIYKKKFEKKLQGFDLTMQSILVYCQSLANKFIN